MAQSFISELGDRLGGDEVDNTKGEHVKIISAEYYKKTVNGVVTNERIQDAIGGSFQPRMTVSKYIDISWSGVSWSDFCGIGSNSLIQQVFGSSFSNLGQTAVVLGRMTHPPVDWATNTGMVEDEFKFCTFIGIKTRDQVFVEFISNEKLASAYTQHKLTFMLNPNAASGSCVLSISKSVVINKNGNSFAEGSGSPWQPVYINSSGSVDVCVNQIWNQARSDGDYRALEPRWYMSSAQGYLPAMASGEVVYFRIDNDTSSGGRYSFAVMLNNLPCSISLRADLWSYGEYHVMVDERNGYANNIYGGIMAVAVKGASSSSNGKYHLYIAVKTKSAITANTYKWSLASSNSSATPTICTQAEYDADTLTEHLYTLPSSTSLMSTDRWYYRNTPYLYGISLGSSTQPVYIDSTGTVQVCSTMATSGHNHDSRYYTESEIDAKLANINNVYEWVTTFPTTYEAGKVYLL